MEIKDLVGYQLVDINVERIIVSKNGVNHTLEIVEDEGDCCGYNAVETSLLISSEELNRNPIITKVEIVRDEDKRNLWDEDTAKITFFGESKPLAILDSLSSSGSGCCYGACVSIRCKTIEMDEEITCW